MEQKKNKTEQLNSLVTEENLQKAMEFIRQNPEKMSAISINDLLKQLKKTHCREEKKGISFLFELLVILGVKIDGDTFRYAIDLGLLGLVKLLVEQYGFDVNNGKTYIPIIVAVDASSTICTETEKAEIVKFLISKGADIHVNKNYPLEVSSRKKQYKLLKVLLNADESI